MNQGRHDQTETAARVAGLVAQQERKEHDQNIERMEALGLVQDHRKQPKLFDLRTAIGQAEARCTVERSVVLGLATKPVITAGARVQSKGLWHYHRNGQRGAKVE